MRENPVIADWVPISGGSTEGLLGRWLAQRQAALRGMLAAGARFDFTLVSRACRFPLEHLVCQRKDFFGKGKRFELGNEKFEADVLTNFQRGGKDRRCRRHGSH
jgi:hypothetical protein